MTKHKISADYAFPVFRDPIKDGILIFDANGKIIDIIDPAEIDYEINDIEKYIGIICPAFVNSHCHTELSYLKGKIEEKKGLDNFIRSLQNMRQGARYEIITEAIFQAENEMLKEGIIACGDISNTFHSIEIKKRKKLKYHNFLELFGSNPKQANKIFAEALELNQNFNDEGLKTSIVPHSTYSVSKELMNKISTYAEKNNNTLILHHQENEDENHFFKSKDGEICNRMTDWGIDISNFKASGERPLKSISKSLSKNNPLILVHNTVSKKEDIEFAESYFNNLWWCLCPSANLYIEDKLPDIKDIKKYSSNIIIGTDSLASNHQLSILEEIKIISKKHALIDTHELIKWATINGAEALGLSEKYGNLEKGKNPGIVLIENVKGKSLTENSIVSKVW